MRKVMKEDNIYHLANLVTSRGWDLMDHISSLDMSMIGIPISI
jgi:hypothetical protein